MNDSDSIAVQTTRFDARLIKVVCVVLIGPFMTQLDATVVNVSLPIMRQDLHATLASAQWVISAYLLALALMLPLNGWLVDRFGAKRLYLTCFSAFTLTSIFCGLAQSMNELIAARVVQGIAGGLLAPMTQMMLARVAGQQMARVMGYASMPILIAPILGPVVAGLVLKAAGWSWLFFLNVPIGIAGLLMAALILPRDEDPLVKRPLDLVGFFLLSPGLVLVLYGFGQMAAFDGRLVFSFGVLLIVAFLVHAVRKGNDALIDLKLFHNSLFTTAAATQFLANSVFYARQFLVPLYFITGCALQASQAGWLISAMGVGMMCSFPLVGSLTDRFGARAVSAGGALVSLMAWLPFLWMSAHGLNPILAIASLFAIGMGHGTISIPSISVAYSSVAKEQIPTANTALNIVQRLGGPLATTSFGIFMSVSTAHFGILGPKVFLEAFVALLVLQIFMLASSLRLPVRIGVHAK